MSLVRRPQRVRRLMDDAAFAQGILDRVTSVLGFSQHDGITTVDLASHGHIPSAALEGVYVVRIGHGESIVAKAGYVSSGDGSCRLYLGSWRTFVNIDPARPPLRQGIHLWLGAAWRLVPLSRAA